MKQLESFFIGLIRIGSLLGLFIVGMLFFIGALLYLTEEAGADQLGTIDDEPMIVTEIQGRRDSIATGVLGDNAVNLYRTKGPRGGQTIGTVGDRVILIDHFPDRRSKRITDSRVPGESRNPPHQE